VAEWWRGTHKQLLEIGTIEPLTLVLAREAGLLLARTGRNNAIDALVVASAAQRGDLVITDDPDDIQALAKLVAGVDVDVVG
jgi:predicted nucleic acid-binding protein